MFNSIYLILRYLILLIRKCNAIDKMIFNMDNKTLSLKCERSFSVPDFLLKRNIATQKT